MNEKKAPAERSPELLERLSELRGPQTDTYQDMFGGEFPVFGNSKIYWITNIGMERKAILETLADLGVEILEPISMFGWIQIVVEDDEMLLKLKSVYGRDMYWDGIP